MSAKKHEAAAEAILSAELVKFPFHGDELDVVPGEGVAHLVVRRVCEVLGVSYQGQIEKLKSDPSIGLKMILTPSAGGPQETACIDIRSLPLWLATIHPSKVKPDVREKLVAYKRECAEVLAEHFLGRRGVPDDGDKTRDLVAGLYMRVEGLERLLRMGAANAGTITGIQSDRISYEVDALAYLRVALGYNKNHRGAVTWINQRIVAAAQWGGTGMRRRFMPSDRYPLVMMCLETIRADLDAEARRRKLKGASALLKKAVQEQLFSLVEKDPGKKSN